VADSTYSIFLLFLLDNKQTYIKTWGWCQSNFFI